MATHPIDAQSKQHAQYVRRIMIPEYAQYQTLNHLVNTAIKIIDPTVIAAQHTFQKN